MNLPNLRDYFKGTMEHHLPYLPIGHKHAIAIAYARSKTADILMIALLKEEIENPDITQADINQTIMALNQITKEREAL